MEQMKTHTGELFSDMRKLFGYTQIEMATRLNISQSAVSKVEASVFVPELTLWFDFVKEFGILDPYCFYYGTAELKGIPDLMSANKENWHGVWSPKHRGSFSMTVRALGPVFSHLREYAGPQLKTLLQKNGAPLSVLRVLNYPVPWDVVWGAFELVQESGKALNLATMAPRQEDHGAFFNQLTQQKNAQSCIDFVMSRPGDYFGTVKLPVQKGEAKGIPMEIPRGLKKPFTKYLSDYPTHLSRKPVNQLSA